MHAKAKANAAAPKATAKRLRPMFTDECSGELMKKYSIPSCHKETVDALVRNAPGRKRIRGDVGLIANLIDNCEGPFARAVADIAKESNSIFLLISTSRAI